jgi:hypothetical protein
MKTRNVLPLGFLMWCSAGMWCSTAVAAAAALPVPTDERLGTVDFPVSCAPAVARPFSRGVALLHDFWYAEARAQFTEILATDPDCAMAHWGIAMSVFHALWARPDDTAIAIASSELEAARAHPARTARERQFIAALSDFFQLDARGLPAATRPYQVRIDAYAAAMAALHRRYPGDVDAAAFHALSLLAAEAPDDTSLRREREAQAVLRPWWLRAPDHPGVVHYMIHACDNPALAPAGLAAAEHYGAIAGSAPHAAHMPGHIFARLGMWQSDIVANAASVRAADAAEANQQSGAMDQFHADDFLVYAYLQSGRDADAQRVIDATLRAIHRHASMQAMADQYMTGMFPYYETKLPVFYALERRDWAAAASLQPVPEAEPETRTLTYWARGIADGHLHQAAQAQSDLDQYDALIAEVRSGPRAYLADSVGARIKRGDGLYNAGRAAEAAEDPDAAKRYYDALLEMANQGAGSDRPEIAAAQRYLHPGPRTSGLDRGHPTMIADIQP